VILAVLAAVAADDKQALAQNLTEDAELEIHGFAPFEGVWRKRDAFITATLDNFAKLVDQKTRVEALVEQGEQVVLLLTETGRLKTTGESYNLRGVLWWSFSGGKLSRVEEFLHSQ
jgi:ketosteroid isomerase-like protein